MSEDETQHRYQGQSFASKESMDLFIASRGGSAKNHADFGTRAKRKFPWQYVAFGFTALLFLSCIFQPKSPATVSSTPAALSAPTGVTENSKATLATLINLHGELCAKVTDVSRISGDMYRVVCVRYRDGTGAATYEVNAATGAVK